ncbi:sodium:proton antiporter [Helicobacter monodelphidis]|uniref:cation:proton antiporter n=1 Tax=Helicobacter sp. 15-1451 TaxID=2004995 RepID=UPI000DCD5201|nr:cation:proton antiporter [Helicobacter sp. 15-1451]RAX58143.1 sodium:proton antiporter [Helicobacter sp. 15-1451]
MSYLVPLGVAAALLMLSPFFSRLTRIPPSVIEILLGMAAFYFGILDPSGVFVAVAKVGFFFLMFLAGMEIDLKEFFKLGKSFLKRAFIYFSTIYILSVIIAINTNYSNFYVIAFPVMSVGMIMALLKYYGKNQIWLNNALQIGILGEFLSIIALVLVSGFYRYGFTFELYKTLLVLFLFLAVVGVLFMIAKIIFWWFPLLKLYFIPKEITMNEDIRFSMMLFFVMIAIVTFLDIDHILGAFFAGMIITTFFRYNKELPKKLHDFGFGFLVPLFFVFVGTTLDINIILQKPYLFMDAIQLICIMLCIHLCAGFLANRHYLKDWNSLLLSLFSSCMPLTFLVAFATLGHDMGAITSDEYYTFVIAALSEGILFVIIIKFLNMYRLKNALQHIKQHKESSGKKP